MLTPDPGVVEYLESEDYFLGERSAVRYNAWGVQAIRDMVDLISDHCPYDAMGFGCRCWNTYPSMLASLADQWGEADEAFWLLTGDLRTAGPAKKLINHYRDEEDARYAEAHD